MTCMTRMVSPLRQCCRIDSSPRVGAIGISGHSIRNAKVLSSVRQWALRSGFRRISTNELQTTREKLRRLSVTPTGLLEAVDDEVGEWV